MSVSTQTFQMADQNSAIEYLRSRQGTRPFNCPYLVVVKDSFRHGNTTFEKGHMLCTSGFLDLCCLFNRARADENGNVVAKCRKNAEEVEVVLKNRNQTTN